ncbi:site-specific integrase [Azospirillum himalayense]|uniref:Tyrosine-type recombinase/integrase n=1 Tax=Azospirillum himalayense TaxID=654847 RepID=A0ABW0G7V3_9PROT
MTNDEGTAAGTAPGAESLPAPPDAAMALPRPDLTDLVDGARAYMAAATSPATRRAYAADWRIFQAWCDRHGLSALPTEPAAVVLFLTAEATAGRKVATIERRLAAIGYHHRAARLPAPTAMPGALDIERALKGIRRTHGVAPAQKAPATAELVERMVRAITGDGARDLRDRALLTFGMATAQRRSTLAAIRVEDLTWAKDGVELRIPRSKTDQEGRGRVIGVPRGLRLQPVHHLEAWMERAGIAGGFLFRRVLRGGRVLEQGMSGEAIALVVQERAAAAGLDPAQFGGHSLRAGFLTSAIDSGADLFRAADQSGHQSLDTLRGYVRRRELFKKHAGAGFL